MVREWRKVTNVDAKLGMFGNACVTLWVALVTLCIILAVVFSCEDGVSKEKTSAAADSKPYGAACGA